jgi:hypothetical protein
MKNIELPFIPTAAVFLKDLLFIHSGNSTLIEGMINWEKVEMMSSVIMQIVHAQHSDFQVEPELHVARFIEEIASLKIMPKATLRRTK